MKTVAQIINEIPQIQAEFAKPDKQKKLQVGLVKYQAIQAAYNVGNVMNSGFQATYGSFYRLRVSKAVRSAYFQIMQQIKNGTNMTFSQVAYEMNKVTPKHQFSFITKLLHTTNTAYPIYDSLVAEALDIKKINSQWTIDKKIQESEKIVADMSKLYQDLIQEPAFQPVLALINAPISDVKKCDFIFWVYKA